MAALFSPILAGLFIWLLFPLPHVSLAQGAKNVTIDDTSSYIQYVPVAGSDAYNESNRWIHQTTGKIYGDPYLSSCYGTSLSAGKGSAVASFTFQGSAVYLQSLIYSGGAQISVTLDGIVYPPINLFSATQITSEVVFSQENLDPNSGHTLMVQKLNASASLYSNIDAIIYTTPGSDSNNVTSSMSSTGAQPSSTSAKASQSSTSSPVHYALTTGAIAGIAIAAAITISVFIFLFYRRGMARSRAATAAHHGDGPTMFDLGSGAQRVQPTRNARENAGVTPYPYAIPTAPTSSFLPVVSTKTGVSRSQVAPDADPHEGPSNGSTSRQETEERHMSGRTSRNEGDVPPPQYEA